MDICKDLMKDGLIQYTTIGKWWSKDEEILLPLMRNKRPPILESASGAIKKSAMIYIKTFYENLS